MEDIRGIMEGTHACFTINDDSDVEEEVIDIIDMVYMYSCYVINISI